VFLQLITHKVKGKDSSRPKLRQQMLFIKEEGMGEN
jgi:hypothetical protein